MGAGWTGLYIPEHRSVRIKLVASSILVTLALAGVTVTGFTSEASDNAEGLVIDFGFWQADWVPMTIPKGMNGFQMLEEACHIRGYSLEYFGGDVNSVNGEENMPNRPWGLYTMAHNTDEWKPEQNPADVDVSEYRLVCWSRTYGAEAVLPGTDMSGFVYYGYARDGKSISTGQDLRVVTLSPSITETVASIRGTKYIVGADYYSDYPREIVDLKEEGRIAITGGYTDPNYEHILRLMPDIVFCDGDVGEHRVLANKLRKSGISCVVTDGGSGIESLYRNVWMISAAMGLEANSNKVVSAIKITMDLVNNIVGVQPAKRVFIPLSPDPSPWTSGNQTFINDIIKLSQGKNVFEYHSTSWFMASKELVREKDPDYIIILIDNREIRTMEEYYDVTDGLDPLWKQTRAYKQSNIFIVSGDAADAFIRPGPRLGQAAEIIAKALHPQEFLKLNPYDQLPLFLNDDYQKYLKYQKEAFA